MRSMSRLKFQLKERSCNSKIKNRKRWRKKSRRKTFYNISLLRLEPSKNLLIVLMNKEHQSRIVKRMNN